MGRKTVALLYRRKSVHIPQIARVTLFSCLIAEAAVRVHNWPHTLQPRSDQSPDPTRQPARGLPPGQANWPQPAMGPKNADRFRRNRATPSVLQGRLAFAAVEHSGLSSTDG